MNTGNALLILGLTYLGLTNGWLWWNYVGIIFGLVTWILPLTESNDVEIAYKKQLTHFIKWELPQLIKIIKEREIFNSASS